MHPETRYVRPHQWSTEEQSGLSVLLKDTSQKIRKRQLRFYGHVLRIPDDDPAYRILSVKDPAGWNRRQGRPRTYGCHSWRVMYMKSNGRGAGPVHCEEKAEWRKRVGVAKCCHT